MRYSALWGECCAPRSGFKIRASGQVFSGSTTTCFVFVLTAVCEVSVIPSEFLLDNRKAANPEERKRPGTVR